MRPSPTPKSAAAGTRRHAFFRTQGSPKCPKHPLFHCPTRASVVSCEGHHRRRVRPHPVHGHAVHGRRRFFLRRRRLHLHRHDQRRRCCAGHRPVAEHPVQHPH